MTKARPTALVTTTFAAWLLASAALGQAGPSTSPSAGQNPGVAPGNVPPASVAPPVSLPSSPSTSPSVAPSSPIAPPTITAPVVTPPRVIHSGESGVPRGNPQPRANVPTPDAAAQAAFKQTTQDDIAAHFTPYEGGLTSREVVKQALVTSPEMKKSKLLLTRAEANKQRSNLAFAPRLDLTARYTRLSRVNNGAFPVLVPPDGSTADTPLTAGMIRNFSFPQVLNQYYTQAGITLPITDYFLTVWPLHKAAKLNAEVAALQDKAKALQVAYDARIAFYEYCHLKGAVVVAQASVKRYEANVRDLEALVAAGTATQTDLIRAQSAKAQAEHAVNQYQGGVNVQLMRLSQFMGAKVQDLPNVGEQLLSELPSEFPKADELTAQALKERPEVVALRTTERVREAQLAAKKGAQYPKLNGFFNGYYSNPNLRIFPQTAEWRGTWDLGATLAWSPNDAVQAHTQVTDAEADVLDLQADLQVIELGIGMEAINAVSAYETAASQVKSNTEILTASRRYYDDKRALLMAGAATPNEVLEAETQLTSDALQWLDAYVNLHRAEAALLKVRGKTGVESDAPQDTRKTP